MNHLGVALQDVSIKIDWYDSPAPFNKSIDILIRQIGHYTLEKIDSPNIHVEVLNIDIDDVEEKSPYQAKIDKVMMQNLP